jgi:hypothetical protein
MRKSFVAAAILALGTVAAAFPANATVSQVSSRAGLSGTTFDWSTFGGAGTAISTPASEPGAAGTVGVASSVGEMLIRQEGTDFTGNFAPGATLLSLADFDRSDTFIVSFTDSGASAVLGVGAQIEPVSGFTGAFIAYLDLYSASNALLGEVSINGTATTAGDNSAPFLGAISDSGPIAYVEFSVYTAYPGFAQEGDLAINDLSLLVANVPEPAATLLIASGLLGMAGWRRRRTAAR